MAEPNGRTEQMDSKTTILAPAGHDPKALQVARTLRDAIDAECVILFGSRARADWTSRSDIDLMIINPLEPDLDNIHAIEATARNIVSETYPGRCPDVDFVHFSSEEFRRKSTKTINNVARFARQEGIIVSSTPEDFNDFQREDQENDYSEEYLEREKRIADANMHYDDMHVLLDIGRETRHTIYCAHQALEHGMKALVSAFGRDYEHTHDLVALANQINRIDPVQTWQFSSNLKQLNLYAGAPRYDTPRDPVTDFRAMANAATDDLTDIYNRIRELTGEDPWAVIPDGTTGPTIPRHR